MIYILGNKNIEGATTLSVLDIQYIQPTTDISKYDILIFTSKYAVEAIDRYNNMWKTIPSYVISKMTAKVVEQKGGNVQFVGNFNHGDKFATQIKDKLKNKKVLYLKGEQKVSKLTDILQCDELVVYKSLCKQHNNTNLQPLLNSIIIFSSPSTIKCFLKSFKWDNSFTAVSIGKTTAKYFPPYITPIISPTTSLEKCVKYYKQLL